MAFLTSSSKFEMTFLMPRFAAPKSMLSPVAVRAAPTAASVPFA